MPRPNPILLAALLTLGADRHMAAQTTAKLPILQGQVLDAKTKEPIPWAILRILHRPEFFMTDHHGRFGFEVAALNQLDSVEVSGLNYLPQRLALSAVQTINCSIGLFRNPPEPLYGCLAFTLKPIGFGKPKIHPDTLRFVGHHASQVAYYFQNKYHRKLYILKSVSFFLGESGNLKSPFRIRVYRPDGSDGAPGSDILTEQVVISPLKPGWYRVDLQMYNLTLPQIGFFVALEWVTEANHGIPNGENPKYSCGQVLMGTSKITESLTWQYSPDTHWHRIQLALNRLGKRSNKTRNALIVAEAYFIRRHFF